MMTPSELKNRRGRAGWTQEELAQAIGRSRSFIAMAETARADVSPEVEAAIRAALPDLLAPVESIDIGFTASTSGVKITRTDGTVQTITVGQDRPVRVSLLPSGAVDVILGGTEK